MVISSSWRWTQLAGKMDRRLIRTTLFVLHWIRSFVDARWEKETLFLVHRNHPVSNPVTFSCAFKCRVWAHCACVRLRLTRMFNAAVRPSTQTCWGHYGLILVIGNAALMPWEECTWKRSDRSFFQWTFISVSYSETPSTNGVWAVPCFAFCRLPLQFSALIFFVVSVSFSRKASGWSLKNATTASSAFLPIHYRTTSPQFSIHCTS